ncbi:MAG: phospholipid carrier-dependent glycosyltransferase [Anaerolineae bacterium]|nr:phospholipid carrier-dependent glycosyltransferase [Anaerolineae bacterium]
MNRFRHRWLWRVLDIVWLAGLAAYLLVGYNDVPFHGDESTLLFMSGDYYFVVQTREIDVVYYTDTPADPLEQDLRLINGTVGKMAMGFTWDMAGLTVHDLNGPWLWGAGWDWNVDNGHMPTDRLLHAGRLSSILLTVISVWAVFGTAWIVTGRRAAAWIAALVYTTTPAVVINGQRAMMDGAMLCFVALTALVAVIVAREQDRDSPRPRVLAVWYVLLGLAGGSAVASKHNAAVAVLAVFLALLLQPVIRRRVSWVCLVRLAAASALVFLTFLFWNPAWWTDITGMPGRVIELRSKLLDGQVEGYGGYDNAGERVAGLVRQAFSAKPQFYEVRAWKDYIGDQIDAYQNAGYGGRRGGWPWGIVIAGLTVTGLGALVARWREGPVLLVLVWLGLTALTLLILTPLEWQRYYLPLQAPVAVMAGTGAACIGMWGVRAARVRVRITRNKNG